MLNTKSNLKLTSENVPYNSHASFNHTRVIGHASNQSKTNLSNIEQLLSEYEWCVSRMTEVWFHMKINLTIPLEYNFSRRIEFWGFGLVRFGKKVRYVKSRCACCIYCFQLFNPIFFISINYYEMILFKLYFLVRYISKY